ncbi:hypothetical protein Desdi_1140 [Desulfitobacterium dichloroeliminans LMG P-21439]|uniref:Pentapeptide MXKDX repeat protein n=1 Tax=Desulfitobacterium dichloroeliminans (strain LMG P-21439 / DCA1) TaxID=871963 RepID=L0F6L0_DESDL|nr:hypothetical protein [Desulfitobacterium dichloroeliminans]AGA68655.1 hypothetical protein Desdi_1140 [Desulfitobacterium dichloroeliminans LMG P-21439]
MKKLNAKAGLILSSAALALGILAVPVFAGTNTETANQANLAPMAAVTDNTQPVENTQPVDNTTKNNYMNVEAMQNMHESTVMQEAMNSGNVDKMKEAMNSPEIKAQIGEDAVDAMNQMMSNENMNAMHNGNMNSMHNGNMMGSGTNMMNW